MIELISHKSRMLINFVNKEKHYNSSNETLMKLKNISLSLWSKLEELNGKFEKIVEDNTRRLNNQISINQSNY